MGRGRIRLRKIESATSRQVTFSKRKNGLLKKAYELSVLCDVELGLIVLSPRGKVHEFSSTCMQKMLERYEKCSEGSKTTSIAKEEDPKALKREIANMEERIEILERTQRKMLGEELASCALKDLNQLESQVERGLRNIRARKSEILVTQIEQLQRKERMFSEENNFLRKRIVDPHSVLTTPASGSGSLQRSEVETQLVMRPPSSNADFLFNSSH
uniref:Putative MADS box transcription factor PrMADS4 n=1 Tax=Pinus radiata TaxID=3347 RepID=O24488_PINRA|nr:putative MADS box transcription factor PrMADS4 [Pinus radiata]